MSNEYVLTPLSDLQEMANGIKSATGTTAPMTFSNLKTKVADGSVAYTPIRGIDYWTEEDKQEIISDIASADKWEVIEKICFGYELLTEKPDDWDENKTTKYYYAVTEGHSKMALCPSWYNWEPNKYWKYTGEYDTQIQKIQRNQEPDGTPYNFKAVSVFGHIFNTSAQGLWCFSAYLYSNYAESDSISGVATLPAGNATYPHHFNYRVTQQAGVYDLICYSGGQGDKTTATGVSNAASGKMMMPITKGTIKAVSFHIYSAKQYYSEGDYIEIWGVRADG